MSISQGRDQVEPSFLSEGLLTTLPNRGFLAQFSPICICSNCFTVDLFQEDDYTRSVKTVLAVTKTL